MNKIHLKKSFKLSQIKPINLIAIFVILILIGIYLIFGYIKNKIMPSIFKYGSLEAKKFSSIIINDAIDKYITDTLDVEKLFLITNDNGEIKSIDFNTALINKHLTKATKSIQQSLKYIEKGDIQKVEYQADLLENYDKDALKKTGITTGKRFVFVAILFFLPILVNFIMNWFGAYGTCGIG